MSVHPTTELQFRTKLNMAIASEHLDSSQRSWTSHDASEKGSGEGVLVWGSLWGREGACRKKLCSQRTTWPWKTQHQLRNIMSEGL